MGDFLEYGVTPKGSADLAPMEINLDPRGKSGDHYMEILKSETQRKLDEEQYWSDLAQENDFSPLNYLGRSMVRESMTANLFGLAEDFIEEFDPEFDPAPFIKDEWPQWRKDAVMDAKNKTHLQTLLEKTEAQDLYNKEGQYHGGVGTAMQLTGALLNPENLILGVGEVAVLTKLGLAGIKAVAAGATVGSITNTAQEAVIIANDKSRSKLALATAAGFGAGFGAIGGFFPKGARTKAQADDVIGNNLSGAWKNDLDIATGDVKVQPTTVRWVSPDAQVWDDAVHAGTAAIDPVSGKYTVLFGDTAAAYDTKAQAIAAAKLAKKKVQPTPENVKEQVNLDYEAEAALYNKQVKQRKGGRWSSIGLEGLSSSNPFTRKLHQLLVQDASGTGGKQVATHSATLKADRYAMQMRSTWHITRHQQQKIWAKEQGQQGLKKWVPWDTSDLDRFDDQVIREVAYRKAGNAPKTYKASEPIRKAADAYENLQTMRYDMMNKAGVTGYDKFELSPLHISHKWDGIAMTKLTRQFDKEFVISLLKRGILRGGEFDRAHKYAKLGDKLTDEYKDRTAANMAKAIYSRYTRRPDTVNMARAGWLTKADRAEFEKRATDIIDNEADLKHLLASMDGKDSRKVNELLSQIDMDINVQSNGISIRNMMDTNLGASMDTEIRRTAGKTAMAESGFKDRDSFHEFTEKAGRWSRENTDMDSRTLERTNTQNQRIWNLTMGENLENNANDTLARSMRGFRRNATLVSLNQVGFAQFAEMGRLMGSIGVRGMIKQIPEYGRMIKRMKNGTFKDPILNDIESAFGVRLGDNEILNHPMLLAESGGLGITKADSRKFMAGVETTQNKMLHVQGYLNGMNYVMKAQHRMHARGFFTRMWEDLQDVGVSTSRMRRYADIGLTPDDIVTIRQQMAEYTEVGTGWFGQKRPTNINLVQFAPEIREKLALAFHQNQAQAVQRNIGGETAWWMENTLGKLLSQFRTFPLVAIEKQSIHDLKHLDIESFTVATASMGFAALAYTAKTYGNSFGLPSRKRKQYLKNRLTPEKIFAGAASWSGQAAILPDVLRSAGDFGFDTPFAWTHQKGQAYRDNIRVRGLDLGALGAVGSQGDAAYKFATGMGQAMFTKADMNKDTFKHLTRIMPMGNNLAIKAATNYLLND